MNSLLRYFYCGALLLTINAATYSMDGLNPSEQNDLNQQARKVYLGKNDLNQQALKFYMDKVESREKEKTAKFFAPYTSTLLGMRCSENPTNSCSLLMYSAMKNELLAPRMQHVIAADTKTTVDMFPDLYAELCTELRKQNKPS